MMQNIIFPNDIIDIVETYLGVDNFAILSNGTIVVLPTKRYFQSDVQDILSQFVRGSIDFNCKQIEDTNYYITYYPNSTNQVFNIVKEDFNSSPTKIAIKGRNKLLLDLTKAFICTIYLNGTILNCENYIGKF